MPKYIDGVKKIKNKTRNDNIKSAKDIVVGLNGDNFSPLIFSNAKKTVGNFFSLQKENAIRKKEEKRGKVILKKEADLQKEQDRLAKITQERQEKIEKIWQTAEEEKAVEMDRKNKKLKKQRAKEKLKAESLALKMQKRFKMPKPLAPPKPKKERKNYFGLIKNFKVNLKIFNVFKLTKIKELFVRLIRKIKFYLAMLFVIMILVAVVFSVIIYTFPKKNSARQLILNNIPFPLIFVDYRPISYKTYLDEERLFGYYYLTQMDIDNETKQDAEKLLKLKDEAVLKHIVEKNILQNLRDKYGIVVYENEKQAAFKNIAAARGGEEAFIELIYGSYGLTKDLFMDNVAYYEALKAKLDDVFISDNSVHRAARLRINNVAKMLAKGANFEELAEKYSEDNHALKGGDIGYLKVIEMSDELQSAVNKLDVNMISKVLLDKDRYYLVKLYDRTQNNPEKEEVWLKQISIFTNYNFEQYLEDLKNNAKIWNFTK